jgi:hypothetical protein
MSVAMMIDLGKVRRRVGEANGCPSDGNQGNASAGSVEQE